MRHAAPRQRYSGGSIRSMFSLHVRYPGSSSREAKEEEPRLARCGDIPSYFFGVSRSVACGTPSLSRVNLVDLLGAFFPRRASVLARRRRSPRPRARRTTFLPSPRGRRPTLSTSRRESQTFSFSLSRRASDLPCIRTSATNWDCASSSSSSSSSPPPPPPSPPSMPPFTSVAAWTLKSAPPQEADPVQGLPLGCFFDDGIRRVVVVERVHFRHVPRDVETADPAQDVPRAIHRQRRARVEPRGEELRVARDEVADARRVREKRAKVLDGDAQRRAPPLVQPAEHHLRLDRVLGRVRDLRVAQRRARPVRHLRRLAL